MSETEEYIERVYPKFKHLLGFVGMTKDQWIEAAHKEPEKKLKRCENCKLWKCGSIKSLEEEYPMFVSMWHDFSCEACTEFILKTEEQENSVVI